MAPGILLCECTTILSARASRRCPLCNVVECFMRMTFYPEANAAYLYLVDDAPVGSAVEQVVVERESKGDIVLDFDADGRLLGVEVIGAMGLLSPTILIEAEQI